MIYFDHNATSPLCDLGRDAWLEASERFYANPSSRHRLGQRADGALEGARESLAEALGCSPLDLIWTSGATESANAVFIHAFQVLEPEAEVWVSQVEHPCVHEAAERYFKTRVRLIPVTREGVVDLDWLADAIKGRRNPGLVAVMAANNVTGVVQPWEWIRSWCEDRGILFFCDGAQWMGRRSAAGFGGCSFFSGCLHKNGGPRGIGFLKCPNKGRFYGAIVGGPQLEGRRAGTENLPGAIALAKVLAHFEKRIADEPAVSKKRGSLVEPGCCYSIKLTLDWNCRLPMLKKILTDTRCRDISPPKTWQRRGSNQRPSDF